MHSNRKTVRFNKVLIKKTKLAFIAFFITNCLNKNELQNNDLQSIVAFYSLKHF